MSAGARTESLTLFADPARELWAIGVGSDPADWTITTPAGSAGARQVDLEVSAERPALRTPGDLELIAQGRVRGTIEVDGLKLSIDRPAVICGELRTSRIGSVRVVGAWFEGERELALCAARPRRAGGQDRDTIEVIGTGDEPLLVIDPRLSTTYDSNGSPRTVGIELWVSDETDGEERSQRMSGTRTGAAVKLSTGELSLSAHALRCRGNGGEGMGVYALLGA